MPDEHKEYWDYDETSKRIQNLLDEIWGCAYEDTEHDIRKQIKDDPDLVQILCRYIVQQEQKIDSLRDLQSRLSDINADLSDVVVDDVWR